MELENGAREGGPTLEARFARGAIGSEHIGVSHFRYAPGRRSNRGHSHREQEEVYVVLSGRDESSSTTSWSTFVPGTLSASRPGRSAALLRGLKGSSCSRS